MFGHEGREEPEDDLAEDIYRLPFGACIVLHELVDENGLASYGEAEVRHNLAIGAVEILLLSEDLKKKRLVYHCPSCKAKTEKTFRKEVEETEIKDVSCALV